MNPQEKMNLLRQVLTFFGALLAGHGLISAEQASSAVNYVITIVPAAVSLGSLCWSVYAHRGMKKVPENAVVLPPGSNLAQRGGPVIPTPK